MYLQSLLISKYDFKATFLTLLSPGTSAEWLRNPICKATWSSVVSSQTQAFQCCVAHQGLLCPLSYSGANYRQVIRTQNWRGGQSKPSSRLSALKMSPGHQKSFQDQEGGVNEVKDQKQVGKGMYRQKQGQQRPRGSAFC